MDILARSREDELSSALWTLLYIVIPELERGKHTPETLLEVSRIQSSWFAPCPGHGECVGQCVAEGKCGCGCGHALRQARAAGVEVMEVE
jgi:hypothetical protein